MPVMRVDALSEPPLTRSCQQCPQVARQRWAKRTATAGASNLTYSSGGDSLDLAPMLGDDSALGVQQLAYRGRNLRSHLLALV